MNCNKGKSKQVEEKIIEMDQGDVKDQQVESLPPGFRFHPSDEELITYYLVNKISDSNFIARAIGDVDLNKCEPWDLPGKAKMGEKEWYFFSLRDRKYPTGVRTNRATNTGYWKTTGKDKEIFNSVTTELVGMKKTLVFYRGRAPRGEKTNWVMHEYRIHSKSAFRSTKDEWVVCRVFQKTGGIKKFPSSSSSSHHQARPSYNLEMAMAPPTNPLLQTQHMQMQLQLQMLHHHQNQNQNHHEPYHPFEQQQQLADLTRLIRGPTTSTLQQQINYPTTLGGSGGGQGFSISGLNLNRPMPMGPMDGNVNGGNGNGNGGFVDQNGFGVDVNGNRYMGMENCVDLDGYWPSY